MPIGSRIPMYCTGSGRAYLSALDDGEAREALAASELKRQTQFTLTGMDEILAAIETTRRKGYAINNEELFLGDMTIAAPILGSQGRPVASVHVVAPTSRWTLEEAERRLAPAVIECARAIRTSIRTL
ncbi:Pca operon regulatory protein [compost metagenome]